MNGENKETFFKRVESFFAPSVVRKVELAYILAKYAHRAQIRKELDENGDPLRYFEHVRRATLIGLDIANIIRPDTTIALLLHDTLEDTRLTADMIEDNFGSEVCGIVKVLSKAPKEGYLDRFLQCSDWRPYFCKACDRLDNLRSLDPNDKAFVKKQVTETEEKYPALLSRMVDLAPPEHRQGIVLLRSAIHATVSALKRASK